MAALAPDDPRWASVTLWTPRGPLAADPAVTALVGRSADPRDRVLWAGDVDTQRVVLTLTYTGTTEDADGTLDDVSSSEPFVRAYQGPRGIAPERLTISPLSTSGTIGTTEVVAVTLPGGQEAQQQSLLIVLTRPTLRTASVSDAVRPLPDGTVERSWSPLPLEDGVSATTLDTPRPLATRLRVGAWEGPPDSFTESYSAIAEGPGPSSSPQWAEAHLSALTGIPVDELHEHRVHRRGGAPRAVRVATPAGCRAGPPGVPAHHDSRRCRGQDDRLLRRGLRLDHRARPPPPRGLATRPARRLGLRRAGGRGAVPRRGAGRRPRAADLHEPRRLPGLQGGAAPAARTPSSCRSSTAATPASTA